ncbi:class III lanthipeptide [Streptomyces sp. CBMA29]|uniref:class III lanthipeptide n=1 Tax=Streptomyces sp. CBMA29 TaxID=1896314 RepID=UPI001661B3F6|nr:class III lanthipeptide [Streptomyces sp. CBMA29]MBD0738409.1 hypothetical protein [Streptomyces sp. CBMA29]
MNEVLRLQTLGSEKDQGKANLQPVSVAGSTLSVICGWDCVWGSSLRIAQEPQGLGLLNPA